MIVGLLIGKEKSLGTPGKNVMEIVGRPMAEYGFLAAHNTRQLDRIFVSTDSQAIAELGERYGAEFIERPPELATPDALTEDALSHAFRSMEASVETSIEIIALFFANAPTLLAGTVERAIDELQSDPQLDSVITVARYDMWSPLRARRIDGQGLLKPYVDFSLIGDPSEMSSIRGEEGPCYFADLAVQVVRRRCLVDMEGGMLPFKWLGQRIKPIVSDYGFDLDFPWQYPVLELWLREHGFTESTTPYDDPEGA